MRRRGAFILKDGGRALPIGRYMGRVAGLVASLLIALPAASGAELQVPLPYSALLGSTPKDEPDR